MKKLVFILCCICILLLPVKVSAAGVGDVYAALRDIGVPEEYVSQAAGMLARGTSDGVGVYRSDGSYYSYSDMVGYIYANQAVILAYCGITGAEQGTEAPVTDTVVSSETAGSATEVLTESTVSEEIVTEVTETEMPDTMPSSAVSSALTSASLSQTGSTSAAYTETELTTSVPDEAEPQPSGKIAAAALGCIALAAAGFAAAFRILRKQENTEQDQFADS